MSMPEPLFDAAGLPIDGVDAFWGQVIRELFQHLNDEGWDLPSALFALLTPAASEAAFYREMGVSPDVFFPRDEETDNVRSLRQFTLLSESFEHPRAWMPGLVAPTGTGAVALVTEAWQSQLAMDAQEAASFTSDKLRNVALRPSTAPDRIEIRQATVITADGAVRMYRHVRGTDLDSEAGLTVFVEDGEASRLGGILPLLARRTLGLPVDADVSVRDTLSRVILVQVAHSLPKGNTSDPTGLVATLTLQLLVGLLTGLATDSTQDNKDIFLFERLRSEKDLLDILNPAWLERAREIADWSWETFFSQPGQERWRLADMSDDLVAWYGPDLWGVLIEERLPTWTDVADMFIETGVPNACETAKSVLALVGWVQPE